MSFVCNFVDSVTFQEFWGVGETVQEAWEDMLSENDFVEEDINMELVTFFQRIDVTRETKTVWETLENPSF